MNRQSRVRIHLGSVPLRWIAILLAAALVSDVAAVAQTAPDYSRFTAARFIPFVAPLRAATDPSSYHPPELRFAIDGKRYVGVMDTGSTGVMLSAKRLPGYRRETAAQYPLGWEFLSSSKRLWVGRWIPKQINFLDARGAVLATATVPVLAVERETICPLYDEKKDRAECPHKKLHPASPDIHYVGVGFGREHDGQPQGTPDKNPLLNITSINGTPVKLGTMCSGYIIQTQGVHVGLTPSITKGFAYTKLSCPAPPDQRNCSQAPICVSVNGSSCAPGSVLVDTGIAQMYLSVPGLPLKAGPDPQSQTRCILQNGNQVTVRFGAPNAMAFYSFVVDQLSPMQPPKVFLPGYVQPGCTLPAPPSSQSPSSSVPSAFVNTGGNFYQGFDVLFDADHGFFGLRWTGPPDSPQGGLIPGSSH